jgi:hypothetical protein
MMTSASAGALRMICVLLLSGILAAGLWPFRPLRNDAEWSQDRKGLRFGGHGIVYSAGPPRLTRPADTDSCTLELWLRPLGARQSGTIIAFYDPSAPSEFSLFQEPSGLGLRLHNQRNLKGPHFYDSVHGVFRSEAPVFITVASDGRATAVYIDGGLAKTISNYPLVFRNLQGQLVAGAIPTAYLGWAGELLGIATYGRMLTPAEVAQHFDAWTTKGRPEYSTGTGIVALYLFDEHSGRLVHNALGTGADLTIPRSDAMVHRPFLYLPHPLSWDWWDTLLNIAGFAPLGFFFCAYFSCLCPRAWPAIIAVVSGTAISFVIEILQAYLPGRTSDLRDLIANALGTAIGACLYHAWRRTWQSAFPGFLTINMRL